MGEGEGLLIGEIANRFAGIRGHGELGRMPIPIPQLPWRDQQAMEKDARRLGLKPGMEISAEGGMGGTFEGVQPARGSQRWAEAVARARGQRRRFGFDAMSW